MGSTLRQRGITTPQPVHGPAHARRTRYHPAAERAALTGTSTTGVSLRSCSTGEHVYELDIVTAETIYQFSRQLFVRGIAQYDSSRYRALTDFLLSSERRCTVAYVGYGSLLELGTTSMVDWNPEGAYRTTQRGCSSRRRT